MQDSNKRTQSRIPVLLGRRLLTPEKNNSAPNLYGNTKLEYSCHKLAHSKLHLHENLQTPLSTADTKFGQYLRNKQKKDKDENDEKKSMQSLPCPTNVVNLKGPSNEMVGTDWADDTEPNRPLTLNWMPSDDSKIEKNQEPNKKETKEVSIGCNKSKNKSFEHIALTDYSRPVSKSLSEKQLLQKLFIPFVSNVKSKRNVEGSTNKKCIKEDCTIKITPNKKRRGRSVELTMEGKPDDIKEAKRCDAALDLLNKSKCDATTVTSVEYTKSKLRYNQKRSQNKGIEAILNNHKTEHELFKDIKTVLVQLVEKTISKIEQSRSTSKEPRRCSCNQIKEYNANNFLYDVKMILEKLVSETINKIDTAKCLEKEIEQKLNPSNVNMKKFIEDLVTSTVNFTYGNISNKIKSSTQISDDSLNELKYTLESAVKDVCDAGNVKDEEKTISVETNTSEDIWIRYLESLLDFKTADLASTSSIPLYARGEDLMRPKSSRKVNKIYRQYVSTASKKVVIGSKYQDGQVYNKSIKKYRMLQPDSNNNTIERTIVIETTYKPESFMNKKTNKSKVDLQDEKNLIPNSSKINCVSVDQATGDEEIIKPPRKKRRKKRSNKREAISQNTDCTENQQTSENTEALQESLISEEIEKDKETYANVLKGNGKKSATCIKTFKYWRPRTPTTAAIRTESNGEVHQKNFPKNKYKLKNGNGKIVKKIRKQENTSSESEDTVNVITSSEQSTETTEGIKIKRKRCFKLNKNQKLWDQRISESEEETHLVNNSGLTENNSNIDSPVKTEDLNRETPGDEKNLEDASKIQGNKKEETSQTKPPKKRRRHNKHSNNETKLNQTSVDTWKRNLISMKREVKQLISLHKKENFEDDSEEDDQQNIIIEGNIISKQALDSNRIIQNASNTSNSNKPAEIEKTSFVDNSSKQSTTSPFQINKPNLHTIQPPEIYQPEYYFYTNLVNNYYAETQNATGDNNSTAPILGYTTPRMVHGANIYRP